MIVAHRMAEANLSTLLIEGGGPSYGVTGGNLNARRPSWLNNTNLTRVDVPGLYKSIFADGGGLTCGPLINAYGGCTIGGNSAINAGLFFEPPSSDYDLYFPPTWGSANMTAPTQRLYTMQSWTNITSRDGKRYLQSGYDAARSWLVDGLGFKEVDINKDKDSKTEVFGHPIFDYADGQRGGPVTTYLQAALRRPNFHLQSGTRVIRVHRRGNKAMGVVIPINGDEEIVRLTKKGRIILSAGAIQSPALLMFSGIGDPVVLSKLQAAKKLGGLKSSDWINNTAVGANLFDNPNTFIELQSPAVDSYTYSYDSPPDMDKDLYLQSRSGPYTFASQTAVFWDTSTITLANNTNNSTNTTISFQGTIDSSGYNAFNDNHIITLNIYGTSGLLSRGRVVLDSNFIPGPSSDVYYSDSSNTDATAIATFIHKIFAALPSSAAGLVPLNIAQTASVEEIKTYITTASPFARGMVNHWSGSCRIGSCVNEDMLGVKGVRNLHVVDASVLEPLTVNPQFGVMAVAEKGAELILKLF
jgi:cellobiose dehydrogenase (acceptor)